MRVLLYSLVFPPAVGGMERFAADLAQWLTEHGHEVWVATKTPAPTATDSQRPYRVLRGGSSSQLATAVRWAHVVHVNGLALRGIVPAILGGRRAVVTHQGHQAICPTGLAWPMRGSCGAGPTPGPCSQCPARGVAGKSAVAVHRVGARVAARNVCISHYLERRLGLPNAVTIYNPVSERAFSDKVPDAQDDALIAFVGRLVAEKGLDLLLRAMPLIPDARLEVGGDGPARRAAENLATALGLKGRVRFLGQLTLSGVMDLLARAPTVCVPTLCEEAFGYAAAEAMAAGKTVAATPRGALPELLADGRGFVASTCNPGALAESLRAALEDAGAESRAARLARDFAKREFHIDRVGAQYVATYEWAAA